SVLILHIINDFPPNNTPITKVYIFGRPVFIRPPFVIPQRDNYQPSTCSRKMQWKTRTCWLKKVFLETRFMCCNSRLEQVMKQVFDELTSDGKWNRCNVQKLANNLQNRTESVFNTKFEVLVGLGDFASKSHFQGDLICKIEIQDRFVLSYATPNIQQSTDYHALPPSLKTTSTIYLS
ncbi:unnamed protein product, partial [Angiostrongylus costaricensis]|uniref:Ground-like domain-containing protein n=1 Tax=Angiostrongylus costaricensis TaxID=334426 RepID=A0A158PG45_ANGCS